MKNTMKWISVKKRLPKEYTTYLVCNKANGAVWFMDYYGCGWESCDPDCESRINRNDVTHWMSLPNPVALKTEQQRGED